MKQIKSLEELVSSISKAIHIILENVNGRLYTVHPVMLMQKTLNQLSSMVKNGQLYYQEA